MKELFTNLGLSPKEASVLEALLELGSARVSEVSSKAGLNRTTAYDILESLQGMGLVSSVGETKRKTYAAERPDALVAYLERRKREFEQKAEQARTALPDLRSLYNEKGSKPRVRFYEGKAGIESVYEDTLTSSETIRAYASVDDMHKALPGYFPKYYQRRTKKGIHIRAILPDTPIGKERKSMDEKEARESRLVPAEKLGFNLEINVYDDKVAIMSLVEEFGVIIQSKRIAEAQKNIFELAWEAAGKYNK